VFEVGKTQAADEIFRAEIVAALQDLPTDCATVMSMKQRMQQALSRRLPVTVTEFNIIGALLVDPSVT